MSYWVWKAAVRCLMKCKRERERELGVVFTDNRSFMIMGGYI